MNFHFDSDSYNITTQNMLETLDAQIADNVDAFISWDLLIKLCVGELKF